MERQNVRKRQKYINTEQHIQERAKRHPIDRHSKRVKQTNKETDRQTDKVIEKEENKQRELKREPQGDTEI